LSQLTVFIGTGLAKQTFSEFLVRDIRGHQIGLEPKLNEMDAMATFLDSGFAFPFEANGPAAVDSFVLNAVSESNRINGGPSTRVNLLAEHRDHIAIPSGQTGFLCTHPVACDESFNAIMAANEGDSAALEAAVAIGFTYCLEHNQACITYDNVHTLTLVALLLVPMYAGPVFRTLRALGKTVVGETTTGPVEVESSIGPPPTVVAGGSRLPQDINVDPTPPPEAENYGSIGRKSHQDWARNFVVNLKAYYPSSRLQDVRVNQQMVNAILRRVGINRPDIQYTLDGERYYVEIEGPANPRGAAHQARIRANDPLVASNHVIVVTVR
jgi:hypothetical protein